MNRYVLAFLAMLVSFPVFAVTPFLISDIRVEGLERLDAGTVFNYLPLKVGDEMNDEEARISIKALFETGFFRDVKLDQDGTVLVVKVVERPSIASIKLTGNKELDTESLQDGLNKAELVEGRIFNRASLELVEREIQAAYLAMGRYSTTVNTEVEDLDRNRVAVNIEINEGRVAKIKKINIVGARQIKASRLKDEMELIDRKGWRLFTKRNQYSKQKLEADLEIIRSYYLNRGFHDFKILSSSVDISPNKQNIFISIAIEEGERFVFGETTIEATGSVEGLEELVTIVPGKPFSRQEVNRTRDAIAAKYADNGYAFVEVRPDFDTDRDNNTVSTLFTVDPKQRVYVRKINISGNSYTRDEVIRRELRQLEGSWYSAGAVRRSRVRLNRLGFFQSVTIETPSVPGTSDQVDLDVEVVERDTGSIQLSAGYSDADGALLGLNYQQRNVLGTGRELNVSLNNSDAATE
ncbi:MAG: outer membrane protein assembly factor BamA, partial [Gammaproteobacteria bacterium]|nr:outer membrane protein assembly factor BamA [Gammaproteobacteria bacterium]